LHLIKPGLDPSWRMVSEYEVGQHGWVMRLAFLLLASGCVSLFAAIRSQVRTTGGRIGLAFLLISAAGMTTAAIFAADPITASSSPPPRRWREAREISSQRCYSHALRTLRVSLEPLTIFAAWVSLLASARNRRCQN